MSYSYLASPYSHKDPTVMLERFLAAEKATAWLLQNRIWVYSPIVHCHALAAKFNLPTDARYWGDYNKTMLAPADELLVLVINGWEESKGVNDERCFAIASSIPMRFIKPDNNGYEVYK